MAVFNKVNCFVEDVAEKVHNLAADTLKAALTNTAPTAASTVWSVVNFPEPTTGTSGYTAGGNTLSITSSGQDPAGTYKLKLGDTVFTASGGVIGAFRYVVLYNDTAATKPIIGYYDYGSSITLADTETFTIDFDLSNGVLTLA
jgi:hypothetical protein